MIHEESKVWKLFFNLHLETYRYTFFIFQAIGIIKYRHDMKKNNRFPSYRSQIYQDPLGCCAETH